MFQRGKKRQSDKVKTLSAHLRERQEKIQQTLECLAEESARGTPIIVEGKKDLETLRTLGVQGQIVTAKTGKNS
jgi:hypothetical protein